MDDDELIRRHRAGDDTALRELFFCDAPWLAARSGRRGRGLRRPGLGYLPQDLGYYAVYTKDGQIAYYQVDKTTAAQVRAEITPVLRAAGVPFRDEAVVETQQEALREAFAQAVQTGQGGGALSVADELAKLAQLRDQGILADEEFAAQKAKLLG